MNHSSRRLAISLLLGLALLAAQGSEVVSALAELVARDEVCCCGDPSMCHCNGGCCSHGARPTVEGSEPARQRGPTLVALVTCGPRTFHDPAMDRGPAPHERFLVVAEPPYVVPPDEFVPRLRHEATPGRVVGWYPCGDPRGPPEA